MVSKKTQMELGIISTVKQEDYNNLNIPSLEIFIGLKKHSL
jgi:hypothetical protein